MDVLKAQLDQAKQDIEELEKFKADALSDPETFLSSLQNGSAQFPKMQTIERVPDLDISKYTRKTSRRGNTKYEQNLEYLVARVNEVNKKVSAVPPPLLSTCIPVSAASLQAGNVVSSIGQVREKFYEIVGHPPVRPVSAPPPAFFEASFSPAAFSGSGNSTPGPPDNNIDGSMSSTALTSSREQTLSHPQPRSQRQHRVPLNDNELVSAHYNLPWSEEEKKRLDELLLIYPDEQVSSRRYAKIAEALGTRTASQVTNRIHKLNAKKIRHAKKEAEVAKEQASKLLRTLKRSGISVDGTDDDEISLEIDEDAKASEEYQEYIRLKQQLDEIKAQVIEHVGYRCDTCQMDPIVGIRYHCESCQIDFDLCQVCMNHGLHPSTHTFSKITTVINKEDPPQ